MKFFILVADPVAEVGGHAVGADGLGQRHDDRGKDARKNQRNRNGLQNLGFGRPANLTHLFKLGIDGAQRRLHMDVGEGIVVKRHAQHDRNRAIGQPVRDR